MTGFHPEFWQPAWGIRTALLALISHMAVDEPHAIGYVEFTAEERRKLAKDSLTFNCPVCSKTEQKESSFSVLYIVAFAIIAILIINFLM